MGSRSYFDGNVCTVDALKRVLVLSQGGKGFEMDIRFAYSIHILLALLTR